MTTDCPDCGHPPASDAHAEVCLPPTADTPPRPVEDCTRHDPPYWSDVSGVRT